MSFSGIETQIEISLNEVVFDMAIIDRLTPSECLSLGFCYGKSFKNHKKSREHTQIDREFDSTYCDGKICSLIYYDRSGYLVYKNNLSGKTHKKYPFDILHDQSLISDFSNRQVLYISFLYGKKYNKKPSQKTIRQNKPILRLIS